jgi:hypothetical protein
MRKPIVSLLFVVVACGGASTTKDTVATLPSARPAAPEPAKEKAPEAVTLVIDADVGGNGQIDTSTWQLKGNKLRITPVASHTAYVIVDYDQNALFAIDDSKKRVVVAPVKDASGKPKPTFERTGKWLVIANRRCEVVFGRYANGDTSELCMVDLPAFAPAFTSFGVGSGFPLRAVIKDTSGKVSARMEVTSYDDRPIDDARFAVPSEYERLTIPR